jgi:WW domain-binding protein 4
MSLAVRWYYDPKTKYYYGGDPIAWTQNPRLPSAAKFGVAPHRGGPVPAAAEGGSSGGAAGSGAAAVGSGAGVASTSGRDSAAAAGVVQVKQRAVQVVQHPLAQIGGHQMPVAGKIGGAKGIGSADDHAKVSGAALG